MRVMIMITPKIFDSEYNFCLVLWECEPITALDMIRQGTVPRLDALRHRTVP